MIPGVPDCDFSRGEPPLTVEQIRYFEKTYHDYRLSDDEHQFEFTGQTIGKPIESFITDKPTDFTLLDGSLKSYPAGTWMLSTRITDPGAVQTALNGGYTGYSPTVKNREYADLLISALKSEEITPSEFASACKSHSMDGLIKDVVDPVVLSVTLTKKPCQHHSKFCKHDILGDKMSDDAKKMKSRVLNALGMSEEAEVSALKSQVDELEDTMDTKFEALESKFESSLKSMKDSFEETLRKSLKEVGSSKSKTPEEEEEKPEENEETKPPAEGEKPEEEEEEEKPPAEETKPPKKKQKGASKSRSIHNNEDPQKKEDVNTYKAMGRNPDGTAKRI